DRRGAYADVEAYGGRAGRTTVLAGFQASSPFNVIDPGKLSDFCRGWAQHIRLRNYLLRPLIISPGRGLVIEAIRQLFSIFRRAWELGGLGVGRGPGGAAGPSEPPSRVGRGGRAGVGLRVFSTRKLPEGSRPWRSGRAWPCWSSRPAPTAAACC